MQDSVAYLGTHEMMRQQTRDHFELQNISTSYQPEPVWKHPIQDNAHINRGWVAPYLRLIVLAAFFVLFALIIVGVQVILAVSNRDFGLATSHSDLHYLWTYGPTAILTLIAASWARVECQTKIMAPWQRMVKGPADSHTTIGLDYLSMFQPLSFFKALRNGDYGVAAATAISIIIRILIVISTALITLSKTKVYHSEIPSTLGSEFVENADGLDSTAALAAYSLQGIVRPRLYLKRQLFS